jgi:CBS domain-containing protein
MQSNEEVYRWMTPCPETIDQRETLRTALSVMRRAHVRHLPVTDKGQLVGLLSERDLAFAERFLEARDAPVGAVMSRDPYVAAPYASLKDVAKTMLRHKYGSAVIVDAKSIVGIFTVMDALRAIIGRDDELETTPTTTTSNAAGAMTTP